MNRNYRNRIRGPDHRFDQFPHANPNPSSTRTKREEGGTGGSLLRFD
uniref:Uncharacterized protein n=1 Tax=Arundo donax TaxID=35708 RepID=A0A0A9C7P3_ARUDO